MAGTIAENLEIIREKVVFAAERAGREPGDIHLLAVSKTKPAVMVIEAILAGQKMFGENRFQGSLEKIKKVEEILGEKSRQVNWHFIGHVQSNKVKGVLENFDLIHSLDSMKLINRVDRIAGELGIVALGLIQVNVSGAESQYGIRPDELNQVVECASGRKNLKIRGLMAIGPNTTDEKKLREAYGWIRNEAVKINSQKLDGIEMNILSMGMSGDYKIAIEEGSNLIRLGTLIFGERK